MELLGKKKYKTGIRWLAVSGVLAFVSVGGWLVYAQTLDRSNDPVPVRLVTAERGDVEIVINESGTVELGSQQQLKSPGEVTVDQVLVSVGDRVRFGQQLVILRNKERETNLDDQKLRIQQQELKVARARQKVEEAKEKLRTIQQELRSPIDQQLQIQKQELIIARNRQKVAEATEKLKAEQQKLHQLERLNEKGFIPGDELQSQKQRVRDAESAVRDAQSTVNTETIELQRFQLGEQQPSELQDKLIATQSELREAQSEVNTQSSELQRLKIERSSIQRQLQDNVVTAPIAGEILDLKVKDGDGVKPGDVLLALGSPVQELVKLQLTTLDAAKVRVNQKARIKVIGPDAKPFNGRVKSLYPQAIAPEDNQQSSRRQSAQAKVPATVQLDQPSRTLIPGSQVGVEIIQAQRQNVVTLDLTAIQRSDSEPFVWIRDTQGKAQKRPVVPGLEGATTVEVKSGLRPGEQVILPSPETPLKPGTPVVLAPAPSPLKMIRPPGS